VTIAERLSPRVDLVFGGKRWRLLFPHSVLLDIEDVSGLSVWAGDVHPGRLSARVMRVVLWAALRRAGAAYSLSEVGSMLGLSSLGQVKESLAEAWEASMPEPDPQTGRGSSIRSWMEAWAIAHEDLRMPSAEWLEATPRMVHALTRQRMENLRQRELMVSRVCSAVANFSMSAPKRPIPDTAWMIHPWPQEEELIGDTIMREMQRVK
jgi:hypothetical protein